VSHSCIAGSEDDPEALGRELGALRAWESVEADD